MPKSGLEMYIKAEEAHILVRCAACSIQHSSVCHPGGRPPTVSMPRCHPPVCVTQRTPNNVHSAPSCPPHPPHPPWQAQAQAQAQAT
jgi:hypothetical protein